MEEIVNQLLNEEKLLLRLNEFIRDEEFQRKFRELQALMHDIAQNKGWWNPGKSIGEQVLMMHTELSEAIEEVRTIPQDLPTIPKLSEVYYNLSSTQKLWIFLNDESLRYMAADLRTMKPEGFGVELADCVIRVMDSMEFIDADLLLMILLKTRYNLTRSMRHGGKSL